MFVVLTGYIDDSGNQDLFTLSCLHGDVGHWFWFEQDWIKLLETVNEKLRKQGRPEISRYHAADCSSCKGEFSDWTLEEQIDLTQRIVEIFRKHAFHIVSYTVNLRELVEIIPEIKPNPRGFAYVVLLQLLMLEIGDFTLKSHPGTIISLIHDRSDYDAALLDAFNQMLEDPYFQYRDRFTTIAPMSWERCVPLQAADLFAYENFKEGERQGTERKMRKSFKLLLALQGAIGGRGRGFDKNSLGELKKMVDGLDEKTKETLFATARIKKVHKNDAQITKNSARRTKGQARRGKDRE